MSVQDSVCYRARQQRFAELLRRDGLSGALITTPENVQYLTSHRPSRHRPAAVWITPDREAHLSLADGDARPGTVDSTCTYEGHRDGPMIDHAIGAAVTALGGIVAGAKIGFDSLVPGGAREGVNVIGQLLQLRRAKDEVEVRLLRQSIAAIESVYTHIRNVLSPGMTEVDVCAECHAAAVRACGGPIGWMGNDFQSNSGGGPPRNRAIEPGELMPLDLGLGPNGYIADLCRTFCIGDNASPAQRRAHQRVLDVIDQIVPQLKPGANCAALHQQAIHRLEGFEGLSFGHHLGHGIGLNAHEAPRVSKNWSDLLAPGDVITIEPGLYGDSVRGGIRLENNYLITPTGCEQLSHYPMNLQ